MLPTGAKVFDTPKMGTVVRCQNEGEAFSFLNNVRNELRLYYSGHTIEIDPEDICRQLCNEYPIDMEIRADLSIDVHSPKKTIGSWSRIVSYDDCFVDGDVKAAKRIEKEKSKNRLFSYEKGMEDAWKLALHLRYMDYEDKLECFGLEHDGHEKWVEIMEKFSPSEVADMVKEYEQKKENEWERED